MNRDRFRPIPPASLAVIGLAGAPLLISSLTAAKVARADVVGRLKFSVKNAADEKPVAGAKIVLKDSAKVRPDVTVTTDAKGEATTPPLENRPWSVTVTADTFQNDARDVTVVADVTTDVEVLLEPLQEKVIKVTGARELVRPTDTQTSTRRDRQFFQKYPTTPGNQQSLSRALATVPGFAQDSVNQAHPRGEHSATAIYINGFLLPGALQGRAGQLIVPATIQTADVQTGGYAPEYGSETAAILNLSLRSGPAIPFADLRLSGGGFNTFEGNLAFGGQAGGFVNPAAAEPGAAKRFGYLVNVSQRNTNNALEPPQPDNQTANNGQSSTVVFGNFEYKLGAAGTDTLNLIVNAAPARTGIANRTGLPGSFRDRGQGFGYGGAENAGATTSDASGNTVPLLSQEAAGQDIYQQDRNTFAVLQYRRGFGARANGVFSLGFSDSRLDIKNDNPAVGAALPEDSSIEFNPTIKRDTKQYQIQGAVTLDRGPHTLKFGGQYSDQRGDESYNLVPASQRALNALFAIDPSLAPQGGQVQVGEDGEPVTDALGNPVYAVAPGTATPTVTLNKNGYYAALFAQDTWKVSRRFSANYGLRFDAYRQEQDRNLGTGQEGTVNKSQLSPRINLAYEVLPRTVGRLSYNRLFIQPPQAQGAVLGQVIQPETLNQYEASLERQFASNQTGKVAYYYKDIRNQLDTGILIPNTQIGAYTTVNLEKASVHGLELSYDFLPRQNVGPGGFLAYAYSIARPGGVDNTGEPVDSYNDHDQRHTLSAGVSYTLPSGATAALTGYYGSGVFSSVIPPDDRRRSRSFVNLSLSTPNRQTGRGVAGELAVENLFDRRDVINFQSPFSGTRFQQGRRVLLTLSGRY